MIGHLNKARRPKKPQPFIAAALFQTTRGALIILVSAG
jgi:hypothetical protein